MPHDHSAMIVGSPDDEAFSPIISPTPPPAGIQDTTRTPTLFMDIPPNSTETRTRHTPPSLMAQQSMSHSMPSRYDEGWNEGGFDRDGRVASGLSSAIPVPAGAISTNPRHTAASATPSIGPAITNANPTNSHSTMSPRSYWRSFQTNRIANSPIRLSESPGDANPGAIGARPGVLTLPPFSQFAQPIRSSAPFGHAGSPVSEIINLESRHQHQGIDAQSREPKPNASPRDPRRCSDATEGGSGSGMAIGRDASSSGNADELGLLRRENANLKERMQKLELTVAEKQEQIQNWMSRMEKQIMRNSEQPM
ncbi:hypothetical protein H4R20_004262 [Coemansia guatemalensis]|uniref:Uncharacterized protein n=1 Tax=Coemansia guatemalensis TaxID=2761395 RepID=A0A9W8HS19_9FUNG|nr:hypothetical protein H4R20_004262 [Coemansia guatemalensis]